MKLEVGQFVRTKWGDIRKIESVWNDTDFNVDKTYYNYNIEEDTLGCVLNEDIIKEPSFDVTDLIEEGDILEINGEKYEVIYDESYEKLGILIPNRKELSIRHSALEYVFKKYEVAIVTKEQFKQMSYKVG